MIEVWKDHFGNTIEFDTNQLYGVCTEGFDFERDSYTEASIQMEKWGYRKVGIE